MLLQWTIKETESILSLTVLLKVGEEMENYRLVLTIFEVKVCVNRSKY